MAIELRPIAASTGGLNGLQRVPIRVLTWNLWHGLNPYQKLLMMPMESPFARRRRLARQIRCLAEWKSSPRDLICLQEVNPLTTQLKKLSSGVEMRAQGCVVNAGVKLGRIGLPPFLEEGLATLTAEGFETPRMTEILLSGEAKDFKGPFGVPVTLQFQERRKALMLETTCDGKRTGIVNLHLHHGPDTLAANLERKCSEILRVTEWLRPRMGEWDLAIICGDFNCEADSPAVGPLAELGFQNAAKLAGVLQEPTWAPDRNAIARRSHTLTDAPEIQAWDSTNHVFDRVYLKASSPIESVQLSLLREPELSDHFGVAVEFSLT